MSDRFGRELAKLALAAVLVLGTGAALLGAVLTQAPEMGVDQDADLLAELRDRLRPLRSEIEGLPTPERAMSDETTLESACVEDSGALLGQPGLARTWAFGTDTDAAEAAVNQVGDALLWGGWEEVGGEHSGSRTFVTRRGGDEVEARVGSWDRQPDGAAQASITFRIPALAPCTTR